MHYSLFHGWKVLYFDSHLTDLGSSGSGRQSGSLRSGNGLALNSQQRHYLHQYCISSLMHVCIIASVSWNENPYPLKVMILKWSPDIEVSRSDLTDMIEYQHMYSQHYEDVLFTNAVLEKHISVFYFSFFIVHKDTGSNFKPSFSHLDHVSKPCQIRACSLAAIAGATMLAPSHVVKSL